MAKRVDPLKAKEAKQKKIAIVGAVMLLALLAYQGPKTLKMLKGPQAVATPAATTPSAAPGVDPAATGAVPALAAAPPPDLAAVADSDLSPAVEQGQLATFERFSSKDPFAQQAKPVVASAAPAAAAPAAPATSSPPAASGGGASTPPAAATPGSGDAAAPTGPDAGFTTDGSASTEVAAATSISVNGVAEDVAVEGSFPKDEPTFVLVKIAKNGKSVEIGIAGGEYASGGETISLVLGKKLTLQNTADGSRYELKLVTIQGYPVPKK